MKEWMSLKTAAKEYADIGERKLRECLGHPTHPLPARLVHGKWLISRQDMDTWFRSFPRAGEKLDRLVDDIIADLGMESKGGKR